MSAQHRWRQRVSQRWPGLKRAYKRVVHRREHRHLQGYAPQVSEQPGAFVFCAHKAASTYLSRAVRYLVEDPARCMDLEGYLWNVQGTPVAPYLRRHAPAIFHPQKGYVYCPIRSELPDEVLLGQAGLVCVRDPRDVLVSHYHSISRSHIAPAASGARVRFFAARERALALGLDAYALDYLNTVEDTFAGFARMVQQHGFRVLQYERMLSDFDTWASSLSEVLDIPLTQQRRDGLWALSGLGQAAQGEGSHIRNRNPGQFLGLKPQTLEQVNQRLSKIIPALGYSL
ncbi:MAG: hypothetical protein EVA65_09325 [Oceanococcus sp.]|nr:MAG: hypothetical protein EVA65_09325 [Oceanococcus sp.]